MHRKLKPFLDRRRAVFEEDGPIDWAHAEALALASLLALGVPVRLTGQDTERGTFSQRHAVLHDSVTGERYTPLQHLRDANAPFELHNSPLSEQACMGFEYGYSVQAPDALVLWEAQFGDFVNSAQVIVDQFLVSGLAGSGAELAPVASPPHGYEARAPSIRAGAWSASCKLRPRAASAWPTPCPASTHLLRRQARFQATPLILMTPKSLLRLPAAVSTLAELAEGSFHRVLDDPASRTIRREAVTKLVLCSGKVFYDIDGHEDRDGQDHIAGPASSCSTPSRRRS